jgi:hypothetical protein
VVVAFNITLNNDKLFIYFFFSLFHPQFLLWPNWVCRGWRLNYFYLSTIPTTYLLTLAFTIPVPPRLSARCPNSVVLKQDTRFDTRRVLSRLWLWQTCSPPSDREPKAVAAQEARYLPTYLRKDRVGKGHTAQPFCFFTGENSPKNEIKI